MQLRKFVTPFFILIVFLLLLQTSVSAESGGGERFKEVVVTYTQSTWQMVSNMNGRAICQVIVLHSGQPTQSEALAACSAGMNPLTPTPTWVAPPYGQTPTPQVTPTPFDYAEFLKSVYWVLLSSKPVTVTQKVSIPPMVLTLPSTMGPMVKPVVTIKAVEPFSNYQITSIQGSVEGKEFKCAGDTCEVELERDAEIIYWASSSFGDDSPQATATVRITRDQSGYYYLTATSNTGASYYEDSCVIAWGGLSGGAPPSWSSFPSSPESLHTQEQLHYLAGALIKNGLVDARSCPGSGLFSDGSPNACGLETARPAMEAWQNRFDAVIWSSSRELGVPPRLVKAMIEQESQFWPGNSRYQLFEYGLGQLNELGADVALRWDNDLNTEVCQGLLSDCKSYASLAAFPQALMRGGLVQYVNAECPNCEGGIDIQKAEQSIRTIARVLRANCRQAGYILKNQGVYTSIENLWRYTLVSYHAGYSCLENAVTQQKGSALALTWENLEQYLQECPTASDYVNQVWERLNTAATLQPTPRPNLPPLPTPTPESTPTLSATQIPGVTAGQLHLVIFIDSNSNGILDEGERVDGINAEIQFENEPAISLPVNNGELIFDYQLKRIGSMVSVNLPYLYRSTSVTIPQDGNIFLLIALLQPTLPPLLP